MEGDPLPEPEAPVALHGRVERLWFSRTVRVDDSDADGISIPTDGLGTPNNTVVAARDGSALDDSLAGIVPSRYLRAKVAPHADATGATLASHAGVVHEEHTGGAVAAGTHRIAIEAGDRPGIPMRMDVEAPPRDPRG